MTAPVRVSATVHGAVQLIQVDPLEPEDTEAHLVVQARIPGAPPPIAPPPRAA